MDADVELSASGLLAALQPCLRNVGKRMKQLSLKEQTSSKLILRMNQNLGLLHAPQGTINWKGLGAEVLSMFGMKSFLQTGERTLD